MENKDENKRNGYVKWRTCGKADFVCDTDRWSFGGTECGTEKMRIVDISRAVGYENEKHFMKTFKNSCGVSPSEYRKNMNCE